jgi:CRP/FNR family transcriptional regulator
MSHPAGKTTTIPCGDAIFLEGTQSESISLLESGSAKLTRKRGTAREVLITVVQRGGLLTYGAAFGERRHRRSAIALEECSVFDLPIAELGPEIENDPLFWRYLAESGLKGQRTLERGIGFFQLCDVDERLMRIIDSLVPMGASERDSWDLRLSQHEMAQLIGATRETTSSALNRLARRGLLRLGRRRITVPRITSLRKSLRAQATSASQL